MPAPYQPSNNHLPLIDIGVNLINKSFKQDLPEVLARALQQHVKQMIVTGTSAASSAQAIELCKQHPQQLFCTTGIHPHHADEYNTPLHNELLVMAKQPSVVAIGETGLDFNRNFSSPQKQQQAFESQLELAIATGLPVFVHERDAHQRMSEIIHSYRDKLGRLVIHCFTGEKAQAFRYLDLDCHIGITGWICDERRGYHLHEFIKDIPSNRLMIETDAPYLLPRIKPKLKVAVSNRNEPYLLPYVLAEVQKHRNENLATLAAAIYQTSLRFFDLEKCREQISKE